MKIRFLLPWVLILFGISVLGWGLYLEYPSFYNKTQSQSTVFAQSQSVNNPVEVSIPAVKIKASIIEGAIENGVWKLSNDKVLTIAIADSSNTNHATLLYGHDFTKLFGNLHNVKTGDNIYINYKDGNAKLYKIFSKEDIKPSQVDKLSPDQENELILYSCDGFMDTQRVLVKARLI